jgi:uncharacterized phage protein gp47/JayE
MGIDAALYQLCSVFALSWSDLANAVQQDYNSRSPVTAIGASLDTDVAYNGLIRKAASYSTCPVTLYGAPGTVVTNGKVQDSVPQQGYLWDLPATVQIGAGGTVATVATCEIIGAVSALIGQINLISTPTAGWVSVTNSSPAALGQPIETDSQLRTRQAISTELPSETLLAGTAAAVAAVANVTRSLALENPTGSAITSWPPTVGSPPTNSTWYGPPHSLTVIAEGGTLLAVATAIYDNRGIGCLTNGTTTQPVIDPNTGATFDVSFYLPTYVPIYVIVNAHGLTPAFTSAVQAAIQTAVVDYLNGLQLGATVSWSAINAVAMSAAGNLESPIFDVTTLYLNAAQTSPPWTFTTDADISMADPWGVAEGLAANVRVNSV